MFKYALSLSMPTNEWKCSKPQIMEKEKLLLLTKLPVVSLFSLFQVVEILLHNFCTDVLRNEHRKHRKEQYKR